MSEAVPGSGNRPGCPDSTKGGDDDEVNSDCCDRRHSIDGCPARDAAGPGATNQGREEHKAKKPLTPGQKATRERQTKCGAEWKASKAAGKVQKGMTWPKYWSACNKRLKGP